MVLLEGTGGSARSSGARGIDPGVAFAFDVALGRLDTDARDIAWRVRAALREGGASDNSPLRLETTAEWAIEWRNDIRRRLTILRGGIPGPVAPWGPGGIHLPTAPGWTWDHPPSRQPESAPGWWEATKDGRALTGTAFTALEATARFDTYRLAGELGQDYRLWRQVAPGTAEVSELYANFRHVDDIARAGDAYVGPLAMSSTALHQTRRIAANPAFKAAGHAVSVVGMVGDVQTAFGESDYDGAREVVDRGVAVASFGASAVGLGAAAGFAPAVAVVAAAGPALVVVGIGAAVWSVGNLVYDAHEETIDAAAAAAADWVDEKWDQGFELARTGVDTVGDLAVSVGDALTFWD